VISLLFPTGGVIRHVQPYLKNICNCYPVSLYRSTEHRLAIIGNPEVNIGTMIGVLKRQSKLAQDTTVQALYIEIWLYSTHETEPKSVCGRK
jgi:hypothetical protein